jgi:putative ABC transport system permease protein
MGNFLRRLRWLVERRRKEAELREELEFHLEEEREERQAEGLSDAQARAAAHRDFGSVALIAEDTAATWGWPRLEQVWHDVRYAARWLMRSPGFTAVAVLTLALGIGANTAIFSVVHSVLLKPLPYAQPDDIHSVEVVIPERRDQFASLPVTVQAYLEWRKTPTVFSGIAALRPWECNVTGDGEPERLGGARVSANFFSFLGVPVAGGREFSDDDDQPGNERVVVISDALWRRRYGSNPGVIGKKVVINGADHIIVGVAPPSLLMPTGTQLHPLLPFASRIDIWKPLAPTVRELKNESWDHGILVRLPGGANVDQGRRQLARVLNDMAHAQLPDIKTEVVIELVPIREIFAGRVRLQLVLVFAASAMLLLMACANIANLFLARTASRAGEFATRIALGAGRARILSQTLTETLVISLLGGAAGAVIARYGASALASYGPADVQLLADARLNLQVFGFATVASLATGCICGIFPVWQTQQKHAATDLREGARTSIGGGRAARARQILVGVEMALGTALLASSALLLHSFVNVMGADRGYQVEQVMAVDLSLFGQRYATSQGRVAFYREVADNVRALPGVLAAGAISDLPAVAASTGASRTILYPSDTDFGRVVLARPVAMIRSITAGYFAASGTSLRAGRPLEDDERQLAAVISEALARRMWPDELLTNIVGHQFRQDGNVSGPLVTIVGVVEDARAGGVDREPLPTIYRPHGQWASGPMTLVVKTAHHPAAVAASVRREIRAIDPALPIPAVRTMREIVSSMVAQRRFQLVLTSLFALVALLLSAVGLYGVVSYAVACRTRDIGLRMALGAVNRDVMRWVFSHGMRPVAVGLAVGLVASIAIARTLRGLLFGITPADPLSMAGVVLVLLLTSGLACYLPARRAAALDPIMALRHD